MLILNGETSCSELAQARLPEYFTNSIVCPNSAVLIQNFLLKIRSVGILDNMSWTMLKLFSQGWDTVQITLNVGFTVSSVVIDPKD